MDFNLLGFITTIFSLLSWTIVIRVLMSWIPLVQGTGIHLFFVQASEFLMAPVRRLLHQLKMDRGMMDWAPLLTIILLNVLERLIITGLIMR